jgi:hypothetical protein
MKSSMDTRKISTFSFDIARGVSRRLRCRHEHLAPTDKRTTRKSGPEGPLNL